MSCHIYFRRGQVEQTYQPVKFFEHLEESIVNLGYYTAGITCRLSFAGMVTERVKQYGAGKISECQEIHFGRCRSPDLRLTRKRSSFYLRHILIS